MTTQSIRDYISQGAREGAALGALAGRNFACTTFAAAIFSIFLEKTTGIEADWRRLFKGADPHYEPSIISIGVYLVGACSISGMLLGAVSGLSKGIFANSIRTMD